MLPGVVDSIFEPDEQLPPGKISYDESLQGEFSSEYPKIHRRGFSISSVEINIWQIFFIYKANCNPQP